MLSGAGADAVNLLDFTRELSLTEPEEWVRQTLAAMPAQLVLVGENFRFCHEAAADVRLLRQLGRSFGFDAIAMPLIGDADSWSSRRIRESIAAGDMAAARRGLARNHCVEGLVVPRDHRGRDLGYPTANTNPLAAGYGGPVALPADGVYAGWLVVNPHRPGTMGLPAAISVGTNPTFEETRRRRVEAFVLDRDDLPLYDQLVSIEFAKKLRDQTAYPDADSLVAQIHDDIARTRQALALDF